MTTENHTASDMFAHFTMTIGGRAVAGGQRLDVLNPATEQVFATAPDCTQAELDQAVAAARKAFGSMEGLLEFTNAKTIIVKKAESVPA